MLKIAFCLDVWGISDVGLIREHNEDAWKIDSEKGIFIVADGMGGHNAGEIASHLAIDISHALLLKAPLFDQSILKKVIEETNNGIYKKSREDSACHGMGTTLVILVIQEDTAFFAHVGDSRLYLFRDGQLKQLTEDHTLVNDLISIGTLNKEDDSSQFPFKHILTKAIGTHSKVTPSFGQFSLKEGDQFLLSTDGLSNYVTEAELLSTLNQKISIVEKAEKLIELAKNHGGGDNITLVLGTISANDLSR